jgi:hypothetical protein
MSRWSPDSRVIPVVGANKGLDSRDLRLRRVPLQLCNASLMDTVSLLGSSFRHCFLSIVLSSTKCKRVSLLVMPICVIQSQSSASATGIELPDAPSNANNA